MPDNWQLLVYDKEKLVMSEDFSGVVELGRQSTPEERLGASSLQDGRRRLVFARIDEHTISRRHIQIEPDGDFVRVRNLSAAQPVVLPDGQKLLPNRDSLMKAPALLSIGGKVIRIQQTEPEPEPPVELFQSMAIPVRPPGMKLSRPAADLQSMTIGFQTADPDRDMMIDWLRTAMEVIQSAATSNDFFDQSARALIDLVALDSGRVILLENGEFSAKAFHQKVNADVTAKNRFSKRIIQRLCDEKKTLWQGSRLMGSTADSSLAGIQSVVAAPILNRKGEVIGALYGDRRSRGNRPADISELEAMLVELLASGVAAGLARLEEQSMADRAKAQFEQFFGPELAAELSLHPDWLDGRDAEVTCLFCDIKGFSRITERLGPPGTIRWLNDALNSLSECVRNEGGVLVDYIGDELFAMWGAPGEQPDHADRACRAALKMLEVVPDINRRWHEHIGEEMDLCIGVNTGTARVGNTGSAIKFKYGPLGNTVNTASRVRGATRHLHTRILVSGATRAKMSAEVARRRLCKVRVVNINEPVELYELAPSATPGWAALRDGYERALNDFEAGRFQSAISNLGSVLAAVPTDGPSLVLLARTVQASLAGKTTGDVWDLPSK